MKKFILLMLLVLVTAGCDNRDASAQEGQNLSVMTQDGKRHDFIVELALTPQQQARGLMGRTHLDENAGMLFMFGPEEERGFWMKNTLIPLDMLFIRANGTIHYIHQNAVPHDETSIRSRGPVAAVLELNGGTSARLGLKPGDKIHHILFGNSLAP